MNLYLSFLNGGKVVYSTGVNDLLNFETVGMLFAAFVVAVPTLVLRWIFLENTKPRTRLLLSGCMVLVHIATVLWLAWLLCSLAPNEPAQIWNAWGHCLPGRHDLDGTDGCHHLVLPPQAPAQRKRQNETQGHLIPHAG